jgi:hypothetical protein
MPSGRRALGMLHKVGKVERSTRLAMVTFAPAHVPHGKLPAGLTGG